MKILPICLLVLLIASCGSGSNSDGTQPPPASSHALEAKWTITTTSHSSTGDVGLFLINLSYQGNGDYFAPAEQTVACYGSGGISNSECYGKSIEKFMMGRNATTVQAHLNSDNTVTITATTDPDGIATCPVVFQLSGSLTGSSMSGTYTNDCFPDTGSWTAVKSASATGNFSGTLSSEFYMVNLTFSASLQESSTHALTGTATITNSPCVSNLTFGPPSFAIGGVVYLEDPANNAYVFATPDLTGTNLLYVLDQTSCTDLGMGTFTRK